jgi:hypothetical protein
MEGYNERKAKMIEMRNKGFTYHEIGKAFNLSSQRIFMIIGGQLKSHFKEITSQDCIHPNLRKWMNDNRITRMELCRRINGNNHPENYQRIRNFLIGKTQKATKSTIDRYLLVTGLSYEELFETEGDRYEQRAD